MVDRRPKPAREYKYLDIDALNASEIEPVSEPPEAVLFDGLLDIIQLAQAHGLASEAVDRVLARIVEGRADEFRSSFKIHFKI